MPQNLPSSRRIFFTTQRLFAIGLIALGLASLQFSGCGHAPTVDLDDPPPASPANIEEASADPAPAITNVVAVAQPPQETAPQEGAQTPQAIPVEGGVPAAEAQEGMLKKAGDLFDRAKSTTGSTAQGAKDWMQDKISGAADASSEATEDTIKWATDTFESLKSQGLTTANDTSEWLMQDWKNMESWEYQIISMDGKTDDEKTTELNRLGKSGWECYHVSDRGQIEKFYVKKRRESYLRHLPFKDFIKLVPLLQQASQ